VTEPSTGELIRRATRIWADDPGTVQARRVLLARAMAPFGLAPRILDLMGVDGTPFLRRRGVEGLATGRGILIHWILAPDPGLDLHDHPFEFWTWIVRGGYTEEWMDGRNASLIAGAVEHVTALGHPQPRGLVRSWAKGSVHRMPLNVTHRISHVEPGTITVVFRARKTREWGFYLPTGWVHWRRYDYQARRPGMASSSKPEENHLA